MDGPSDAVDLPDSHNSQLTVASENLRAGGSVDLDGPNDAVDPPDSHSSQLTIASENLRAGVSVDVPCGLGETSNGSPSENSKSCLKWAREKLSDGVDKGEEDSSGRGERTREEEDGGKRGEGSDQDGREEDRNGPRLERPPNEEDSTLSISSFTSGSHRSEPGSALTADSRSTLCGDEDANSILQERGVELAASEQNRGENIHTREPRGALSPDVSLLPNTSVFQLPVPPVVESVELGTTVTGDVEGDLAGGVEGDLAGGVEGDLAGGVEGDLAGVVKGDLAGGIEGDLAGGIEGDLALCSHGGRVGGEDGQEVMDTEEEKEDEEEEEEEGEGGEEGVNAGVSDGNRERIGEIVKSEMKKMLTVSYH